MARRRVVTYHHAYLPRTYSLCRDHEDDHPYGSLGAVSHGEHYGRCGVCERIHDNRDREPERLSDDPGARREEIDAVVDAVDVALLAPRELAESNAS